MKTAIVPMLEASDIKNYHAFSLEELVSMAVQARETYDNARWALGDIACVVYKKFGTDGLLKFAREIGVKKDTISRYKEVSERFNHETRNEYPMLSWSHFRNAAPQLAATDWLREAHDNNWSAEQMHVEIQKVKEDLEVVVVKPKLKRCAHCLKYYISNESEGVELCNSLGKHKEIIEGEELTPEETHILNQKYQNKDVERELIKDQKKKQKELNKTASKLKEKYRKEEAVRIMREEEDRKGFSGSSVKLVE